MKSTGLLDERQAGDLDRHLVRRNHQATGCFSLVSWAFLSCAIAQAQGLPADRETAEEIVVIGIAPSRGELDEGSLPFAIQSFTAKDLSQPNFFSVVDLLAQRAGSVTTNAAQNNRLQPDLQFRGFTASPLLGLSQGVAIYQNGVRVNEAFGDTVNWDLLPSNSVERMNVVAGSNPVFGLNALGGAVTLTTRTGFSSLGGELDLTAGSFATRDLGFAQGGNNGAWGYFVAAEIMEEDGWRDFSDSEAGNVYGALSWRGDSQEIDVFLNLGDTQLRGNGAVPVDLLMADRSAVFTHPDITENALSQISASFRRWWGEGLELNVNGFARQLEVSSFNGDGTEFEECGEDDDDDSPFEMDDDDNPFEGFLCDETDTPVRDQTGQLVPEVFNAMNNRSNRDQDSVGLTAQLLVNGEIGGLRNEAIFGLDYFRGETRFSSSAEFSTLTEDRGTTASGRFDAEGNVRLDSEQRTWSVFASDSITLTDRLSLTLSARYNDTDVDNVDPTGNNPDLEGSHSYQRLNGGLGLRFAASENASIYANLQQSSRTPTPVELACSEPEAPCNLPNSFLADPPLDDVVATAFELGVRGGSEWLDYWRVGMFYTLSKDDILFQTTGGVSSNEGFFQNAADTLRQGVEVELRGREARLNWYLNYSYLAATYDGPFVSSSPNNPASVGGTLQVAAGSDIPGLPDHNIKFGAAFAVSDRFSLGADFRGASGQYLRGDEANVDEQTDAYFVADVFAALRFGAHVQVQARIDNAFDTDYETFGLYGEADEVLEDIEDDTGRFLGPAAPRSYWLSLSLDW